MLEELEVHLFTCEIYSCSSCDVRYKKLNEVKAHLGNEHEGKPWSSIKHAKQDRNNKDIISMESHKYDKLFPEMFPKS